MYNRQIRTCTQKYDDTIIVERCKCITGKYVHVHRNMMTQSLLKGVNDLTLAFILFLR
jgi:hypothetical protein